ncbi:MAG: acylneuraminate cytidylyltransferase family protein [Candidatus Thermoplasmatota archaeon]
MPKHAYKYLGLIPARGGSIRVHRKNIRLVLGKPLIYWSIKAAQESKRLDYFVVSTDDPEIARVAREYNAPVLERPKELAESLVPLTPVYRHALETIPAENLVILRPTSPIRINNIIDKAIDYYEQEKGDSLMTGFMNKEYEWFTHPDTPSQQLKGWFQGDGCVEIHHKKVILSGKSWGDKPLRYIIPEIYNHEIDTEVELIMVEALMKHVGMNV